MISTPFLGELLDTELPLAELCAVVLDGEATRLGPAFAPIDVPHGVRLRARALGLVLPSRHIADRRTAAWVHGALVALPRTLDACVRADERPSPMLGSEARIRQVVIAETEIAILAGVSVTTPLRTIFDLLREPAFDDEGADLVRRLSRICRVSFEDCRRYLDSRSHLPRKSLTRSRLLHAFVQHEIAA
ncbi:MAG TPA: hypothetical protein PK781_04190 [Terrimesophilobacter sp.]|nr:hypothetical protein [Terrimesophilobacter sp.]HRP99642.1 hypothetical protein [Terrimesophilobacter sp.]